MPIEYPWHCCLRSYGHIYAGVFLDFLFYFSDLLVYFYASTMLFCLLLISKMFSNQEAQSSNFVVHLQNYFV